MAVNSSQLLISGAGDLGLRTLKCLRASPALAELSLIAETRTNTRHAELSAAGAKPRLSSDAPLHTKAERLLIAFPPSPTYAADVEQALSQWNGKGPALLLSSVGVYTDESGTPLQEDSEIDEQSLIVQGERLARKAGAHILRLAGLYDATRGPHIYWETRSQIDSWAEGRINLIHRDDAADVIVQLLFAELNATTWNLSDGKPPTRREIAETWAAHRKRPAPLFTGDEAKLGKNIVSLKIRHALGLELRWKSFADFVKSLS